MTSDLTIIGATGHLSTRLTRELVARGMRLKVVARDPDRAHTLFGESVEVVHGDVGDSTSLRQALRDSRAVYIHLNTEAVDASITFYPEREGVRNVVAAAEANGVEHLMQIAGMESLRPDFFTAGCLMTEPIRREGMKAVSDSAIPHTFFCCSLFLDSLPRFVADSTFAIFGDATNRIYFTDTDQLATHLFHVAGNERAFGRSLPVQGPRGVDLGTAADEFFRTYDSSVRTEHFPMEAIQAMGLPQGEAEFLEHVATVTAGFQEEFIAADVHKEFGAPTTGIEEFAAKLKAEAQGEAG